MQLLNGTVQRYAWGTHDAIFELLGREPDGEPLAEYWLGAHALSPATTSEGDLDDLVRRHPQLLGQATAEAYGPQLPFLMKVLSARHPLSLQAHPTREQAEAGYARENAAGIALDAPERVYTDDWPKPEILIAISQFESLNGFREPAETARLFAGLGVADELTSIIRPLTERKGAAALAQVFLDVLSLEGERRHLIDVVAAAAMKHSLDEGPVGEFARTAVELDGVFPGDRGILAALLLNRVTLAPGEAFYVAPGQMHAHLRGTGIEVMATSDNVIRGGLTPKHIDVGELVSVVDFTPHEPEITLPVESRPGVERYKTPCPEFDVWRVRITPELGTIRVPGSRSARVVLQLDGHSCLTSADQAQDLARGQAVFVAADELDAATTGDGTAFVAASGLR
ncbi:MAG: mannose-6-phosphate isomerase, class I [Propionibacteriaceae bacterium]|jgi:mannose-6-phosphate isomerase|nr:mannose-6-phosphate isomerase, class I [Propionibacteriaceae bacterium]